MLFRAHSNGNGSSKGSGPQLGAVSPQITFWEVLETVWVILLEGAGAGSEDTRDVASDPMKLPESAAMKNWPRISVVFHHVPPAHRTQPSPHAPFFSPFSSLFRESSYPGQGTLLLSSWCVSVVRERMTYGGQGTVMGVFEVSDCHPGLTSLNQQCYYSRTPDSI